MEKEENSNKENTTAETSGETIGAEQQSEDKQEATRVKKKKKNYPLKKK